MVGSVYEFQTLEKRFENLAYLCVPRASSCAGIKRINGVWFDKWTEVHSFFIANVICRDKHLRRYNENDAVFGRPPATV